MHAALDALKYCSGPSQMNWMNCIGTVYCHQQHHHHHHRMYAGNAEAHLVLHLVTARNPPFLFEIEAQLLLKRDICRRRS